MLREPLPIKIVGTGSYVPPKVVTNDDLMATLDTSDEWIRTRTGICERHYAEPGDSVADFGARAGAAAMEAAGVGPEDIDLLVFATVTADYKVPFAAALVQRQLDLPKVNAFDLNSGCAGYVQAFQVAAQFLGTGAADTALVVGGELMTALTHPLCRNTRVLFGDGAGAVVVRRSQADEGSRLLSMTWGTKGDTDVLIVPGGGSRQPMTKENAGDKEMMLQMRGRHTFRYAVDRFAGQIAEVCESGGVKVDDIKLVVPHQVNRRIIEAAARRVKIDLDRILINLDRYGNTSGASVPLALDEAVRGGRLERGDPLILVGFGAGLAWAGALLIY